ncbi:MULTISPECIES: beta-ketoacyl-ACP synthase II [unclassified Granulicatella]|uniref:beta-ketoacyl-ACP synthase II n=1 Tax=unclassified Granulicatella TaxID=2630493 RepID=UPI001074445A|nr:MULTISPECIES: beta-ketoacyl-ACP synthase II [unclassified Granulicatella]MBF0780893.1 beta-ketoacyl-ACP synthase II [Granulicatella sp. 19428wC4_WM01]TFU93244.1 beta-ketoacyl-[acyl-carrier-protein] synthase II [Granulicatella sp. WM01]
MTNRVVITGLGAITPIGNSVNEYWENLIQGKHGIAPITKFDASETGITLAAEVKGFDPSLTMDRKEYKRMDLFSQYAIAASIEALKDAQLYPLDDKANTRRVGVMISAGIGGLNDIESGVIKMHEKGAKRVPPLFVPLTIGNMAAGNVSMKVGAKGVSLDIVTACASSSNAIGEAFRNIKHGYSDIIIAGGAEGTICQIGIAGFASLTALSTATNPNRASIPFDKERDGFVMGEGAGVVILESLEHALKRNAPIYAEIVGYGSNSDAYHMTAPTPDGSGAGEAILLALQEANISPKDIDYINAHGTSTPTNDTAETKAIKYAFKEHAYHVAISSTKSMTGHLLGGAGGIEAIATIKALEKGILPPTANLHQIDDTCDLDYIPNIARQVNAKYALSHSLGFGGHNAILCFKKWED